MNKGVLIVLLGPSGSGKGTILQELLKSLPDTFLSISATTREKRDGEIEDESYYFVTKDEFLKNIKQDEMLEYAQYCGNFYGTPKTPVIEHLNKGHNVILEIEMQGAKQIKEHYSEAVLIFIMPPSLEVLEYRLKKRNTDSKEAIEKRMETAKSELTFASQCDYTVVNDTVELAVSKIKSIIEKIPVNNINY